MVETALSTNTKIVVPSNTELVNIIGDMAGVLPLPKGVAPIKPQDSASSFTTRH